MGWLRDGFHSLCTAFLMYSRIPMPQTEWKEENRRFSLCFFPLIGLVIGGVLTGWFAFGRFFHIGKEVVGVGAVAVPVLLTGGIHLDGYMDVQDARACLGDREKKRQVMKDSRVGAFAVIHVCLYFLMQYALFLQWQEKREVFLLIGIFSSSRAFSGLSAVCFPKASESSSLYRFTRPAHKRITILTLICWLAGSFGFMCYISLWQGLAALCAALLSFLYYRVMACREFGGITGDLAGYFLQICEIMELMALVLTK